MRVLLDECLPRQLKRDLPGHEARTVPECGWAGVKNGDLLGRASRQFDVLLTVDRNLEYQQNLALFEIAVVAMRAGSNDIDDLRPLMPQVLAVLPEVRPGTITMWMNQTTACDGRRLPTVRLTGSRFSGGSLIGAERLRRPPTTSGRGRDLLNGASCARPSANIG